MAVRYIINRIVIWIADFMDRWYINGFRFLILVFINRLARYDRVLALRVNIKNIFKPMYQDRSVTGYIFALIFRPVRIVMALIFYTAFSLLFIMIYAVWALIPLYLIIQTINTNAFPIF